MAIKKTGRLFYPPFFCRISYMTIATVGDWVLAVDFITCWKIVRAAKKAELIYEKDKEAAEKQFRTEAAKHFEKAFGKGSCWKVFGTHYPSSTGYAEFINQITALIKKWNVVDQGNEILKDFHGYR